MSRPLHLRLLSCLCAGLPLLSAGGAAALPLPQDAVDPSERIIVGPLSAHDFQVNAPDDPGVPLAAEEINLPQLLATLGPDATLWYQHVMTLSNPYFEGRSPGLAGNRYAADYLEFWFREIGLEPAFPAEVASEVDGVAATQDGGDDADAEPAANGAAAEAEVEVNARAHQWTTYRQPFSPHGDESRRTDNVGGVLRGRGTLAEEWVIIGAHYDHTGYGRLREGEPRGRLNPGADDNASGTSAMLVLAQRLSEDYAAAEEGASLRSILFMGFSAEEIGLLGSQHYVRHSTIPADQISIMVNLDMVGRLRGGNLMVQGVESAEGLLDLIRPRLLESGLTIYADPSGQGPSDHASFYGAGIPVLFFFTGTHDVYHRPGDVGPSVDPRGAAKVIELVQSIAWDRVSEPAMLKFSGSPRQDGPRGEPRGEQRPRATLGVVPGPMLGEDQPGVRVAVLSEDSPAAKAGVQVDDILLAWNGEALTHFMALRPLLQASNPGDEVTLTVKRGKEQFDVKITLAERK